MTQAELDRKKELILERETAFANRIGAAVVEKPKVNLWMVLLPILFLHFIYRMKKYKEGRMKFTENFMLTRQRAMDTAAGAVAEGVEPDIDEIVRRADLSEDMKGPYAEWVRVLVRHYMDLLAVPGDDFESLVRSAFGRLSNYLLALNRLSTVERQFYSTLKEQMREMEGTGAIIATIQERSHQLRRELAESIFA